ARQAAGADATSASPPGGQSGSQQSQEAPRPVAEALADPAVWEPLVDPTDSLAVVLPRGWQNRVWMVPTPTMKYPMVTTTSPDGAVTLFSGDAEIPLYLDPSAAPMGPLPGTMLRPPTPATQFLAEWARYRHGSRPGFRVIATGEEPAIVEVAMKAAQRDGMQPSWLTGARLTVEWSEDGRLVRAVFLATTTGVSMGWFAGVQGVIGGDDPASFVPALLRMAASMESTPAEKQRMQQQRMMADAQHQATMASIQQNTAMMTARHQQNMTNIQASGQAFQAGMAQRREAFDAGVQSWRSQQAGADAAHAGFMGGLRTGAAQPGMGGDPQQGFVNMIREETTVLDAQGHAHQVEAGSDRYYHHEYTDTWVGLQEHQDIVEVTGNDDFQEGTIQS
ncbi:MAG: hypothetical protein KIT69_14335, partial [Propionibacteriaceae bacterium]|nr:hypothetical protein [Propionibacteriaceae bacterium]